MNDLKNQLSTLVQLQDADWSAFSGTFEMRTLAKGDYFAREGNIEKKIAFLSEGVMRAFYRSSDAIEYNKTFFVAGDFLGAYASLVRGTINKINIQALTGCSLYVANYSDITDLFRTHRAIESLARIIAEQFYIEKENREIELVILQADERYKLFRQQYPELENTIPQYHIASYLGITPTQLSRIRAKK